MNTSVLGLGKVGVTLSACLASAGNKVIGVDISADLVHRIRDGSYHSSESGVMERLSGCAPGQFSATLDSVRAIHESDVTFVIVPTPSNARGGFSLKYVLRACHEIGRALQSKTGEHTVAIMSTMLPGSSDCRVMACLEEASGRQIGKGLGYCYNPSFIALGEVVQGLERPDYLLIGEANRDSGDIVLETHRTMMRNSAPIVRVTPVEAEITKIASNAHETMRVSFANMLLSVCSEVPGANVDRITQALAHRMGRRFFKGAAPYGGPCWPRDNVALSVFMEAIGVPGGLPRAVDSFNEQHARYLLGKVLSLTSAGDQVGILGMAYKVGTPSIERSFALDLAGWLLDEGRSITAWDPLATPEVCARMGDRIAYAASIDDCLKQSTAVVIVNPLPELNVADWSLAGGAVIDCWRCLPPGAVSRIACYIPLGTGPDEDVAARLRQIMGGEFDLLTS
jgi:UDPglucose 6-dehydrogenase